MDSLLIMWIVLAVAFAVAEALTAQIVTVWFAVGAVGAIAANVLGAGLPVQLAVFVAVSVLTLLAARPYLKKIKKRELQPTNYDMCIGKQAVVTKEINNTLCTGEARVLGSVWTARSKDGSVIPVGASVTVDSIEGVKLIVTQ